MVIADAVTTIPVLVSGTVGSTRDAVGARTSAIDSIVTGVLMVVSTRVIVLTLALVIDLALVIVASVVSNSFRHSSG